MSTDPYADTSRRYGYARLRVAIHRDRVCISAPMQRSPRVDMDGNSASLWLDDPVGLWEALTDALRDEHADHMATYLAGEDGAA